jgi:hypothetical protein
VVFLFTFLAPFSVASAALLTPFAVPFATALPLCLAARPVALPASYTSWPAFLAFSLAPSCASMAPAVRTPTPINANMLFMTTFSAIALPSIIPLIYQRALAARSRSGKEFLHFRMRSGYLLCGCRHRAFDILSGSRAHPIPGALFNYQKQHCRRNQAHGKGCRHHQPESER